MKKDASWIFCMKKTLFLQIEKNNELCQQQRKTKIKIKIKNLKM